MVLCVAVALCVFQSDSRATESVAMNVIRLAREHASQPLANAAKFDPVWVDSDPRSNPRFEIDGAFVTFDRRNLKFKALIDRKPRPIAKTPATEVDARDFVSKMHTSLETGLSLQIESSVYRKLDDCWVVEGTQNRRGIPLEEARFYAEINRSTRCMEIFDLGYRCEIPSQTPPRQDMDADHYWTAVHMSRRMGVFAMEFQATPRLVIAHPYTNQGFRFPGASPTSSQDSNRRSSVVGYYASLSYVHDFTTGKYYQIRLDARSYVPVSMHHLGTNSKAMKSRGPLRPWHDLPEQMHLINKGRKLNVSNGTLTEVDSRPGNYNTSFALIDRSDVKVVEFDRVAKMVRIKVDGEYKFAEPNGELLSAMSILAR